MPIINEATELVGRWKTWRDKLKTYLDQREKCQEMYEFYKRESSDTDSDISLNTPFAIIESMVAKANDSQLKVNVMAEGKKELTEFEDSMSAILKKAIDDPDVAGIVGTFRDKKEMFTRELLIKGNAVAQIQYCYKTGIENGNKKVVADNPYADVLQLSSVTFNPSKTLTDSDEYFIEKSATYDELKNKEYDKKTNKGLYTNLGKLKLSMQDDYKLREDTDSKFIVGDNKVSKQLGPIHILEHWKGAKLTVIANKNIIIRQEFDPFKIGSHNLLTAMRYRVVGRPYAYGEIDPIYEPVRAQDTIVNQAITAVNRYLRPSILINPQGDNVDMDVIMEIMENGGVAYGDPAQIGNIPTNIPPQPAFLTIDSLQQATERAARFSPYAAGLSGQATDQTKGTMGGIQSLQKAAEPNFQVILDKLEESFMQPLGRIYLKMIASLMGDNELRYALSTGNKPEWVAATKGILQGKATLQDLMICGFISEDAYNQVTMDETGNPLPGIDKALVFDVDWIIDVSLDNQSEADKEMLVTQKMQTIDWAQNMGVRMNPERTVTEIMLERGFKEPEKLFMTDEEKQQEMQQMQEQQQAQMQGQAQPQQEQQQAQMQQSQAQMQSQTEQAQADREHQIQIKQMEAEQRMKEKAMDAQVKLMTANRPNNK